MVYALIRTRENEKETGKLVTIKNYCKKNKLSAYEAIRHVINDNAQVVQLNHKLLKQLRPKDVLIISGFSVLGHTVKIVTDFLVQLLKRGISTHSISDSSVIDGQHRDVKDQIKILSILGRIEVSIIQDRISRGRISKKMSGKKLGRPKGSKSSYLKLSGQEDRIKDLLSDKLSYTAIGRITKTNRLTVKNFIILKNLK